MDRKALLTKSWSAIAADYHRLLVPQFMPWIQQTIQQLLEHHLPAGTIVVPACGPGAELIHLHHALPDRSIVGVDIAPGMVDQANRTTTAAGCNSNTVHALVGDACALPLHSLQPIAGVLSTFGLQQMPSPAQVLSHWAQSLQPGGVCAVCYWPPAVEPQGPWQHLAALSNLPATTWEADVDAWLHRAVLLGVEVVTDMRPQHCMAWETADMFWERLCNQAMTRAGPWHARRLQHGDVAMDALAQRFFERYPRDEPLKHAPSARLVVLRKQTDAGGGSGPHSSL